MVNRYSQSVKYRIAAVLICSNLCAQSQTTWHDFEGGGDASQYSALKQINRGNVKSLQVAWTYPTGDGNPYLFSPVVVDDVMYVLGKGNSIVALNATTGKEIWAHANPRGGITTRGLNYWESADRKQRRLLYSVASFLIALDARTGQEIDSFGTGGRVDLRAGLGRDPATISAQSITPGRVFENLVILGSSTNQEYASAPGDIRAYDVLTGKLAWTFHTIPHEGEFGYETWPKDAWKTIGGANAWSEMSLDEKRGIVYIPTASPKYNFYGANRKGANLFGDCLLALDARTGKRKWHFQMVHHDIWDYDNATAPELLTVTHNGKRVDVVAQAGKEGFLWVFNRVTGEPLWPIEERAVPRSDMPGEESWPTQPFPSMPPPFARQSFTVKDLSPFIQDPKERERFRNEIENARNEGMFTPPGLRNTVEMPGNNGGSNWGGAAVDPSNGTLYVVSKDLPAMLKLEQRPQHPGRYYSGFGFMITSSGVSPIAPPWTSLTAYDLNKGSIEWKIPLGEVPELATKGITDTGVHFPKLGPVVTGGGLIFTAARDRKVRAIDKSTGRVLWEMQLSTGMEGIPAVYEWRGTEYLVVCAAAQAGVSASTQQPIHGAYVAFALPKK
jgi:glucose dehydrogenase